jgi:ABC-type transport system substrate-binding protein
MAYKDASGFHLKPEYAAKYDLYAEPSLSTSFIAFNMNDPLVGKNKALRQAIAYALDPAAYVEKMRNGRGIAPTSIVPPAIAGGQNEVQTPWYPHDLAMAKKKLAEAGFPDGKGLGPITVEYRASSTLARQDAEFYRAQLAPAGIAFGANFQTFTAFMQRVDAGNFQVMEYSWGADYPDAENFYALLYGPNKAPGPNGGSYVNPEYDKLYEQIRLLPNGPERFALFARLNEIIREDVPVIPIWSVTIVGLHQKWVKNFKRHMMMDAPFAYLDIDPVMQAKGVPR